MELVQPCLLLSRGRRRLSHMAIMERIEMETAVAVAGGGAGGGVFPIFLLLFLLT